MAVLKRTLYLKGEPLFAPVCTQLEKALGRSEQPLPLWPQFEYESEDLHIRTERWQSSADRNRQLARVEMKVQDIPGVIWSIALTLGSTQADQVILHEEHSVNPYQARVQYSSALHLVACLDTYRWLNEDGNQAFHAYTVGVRNVARFVQFIQRPVEARSLPVVLLAPNRHNSAPSVAAEICALC